MPEPTRISADLRRALYRRSEGRCECTNHCSHHQGRCGLELDNDGEWSARAPKPDRMYSYDDLQAVCSRCFRDDPLDHPAFGDLEDALGMSGRRHDDAHQPRIYNLNGYQEQTVAAILMLRTALRSVRSKLPNS